MAYVADYKNLPQATAVTSYTMTTALLPAHVAGDVLVVGITTGVNSTISLPGWTQILTTQAMSSTVGASAMFYLVCTGSSHTGTIALGTSSAAHMHVLLLKDVDTATPLAGTATVTNGTTASQFSSPTMTTNSANALLIYYVASDSTATTPPSVHTAPDGRSHFLESSDNGATTATLIGQSSIAWYIKSSTATATTPPAWNASLTNIYSAWTVAFRNKTGGRIPAYIDSNNGAITTGTKLMDGHWWASATTRNNENFKATPLTVTSIITHLGTLTGTFDAAASVVDVGLNPYSPAISTTPAASPTALTGFEVGFPTTAINMTTGWIVGTAKESAPKAANFNTGSIAKGGIFLSIGSTTNYRIFQILARDNVVNTEGRAVFSIQANQTQSQSGQSATPPTISAIDKLCVYHRGNDATMATYLADFHLIQKLIIAGGDANNPVDSDGVYNIGKFARVKIIQKQGASDILAMVPLQIGGYDPVNFQIDSGALQFPRIYSRTAKEINYHGADNAIGISYAGKSGDVIKHINSVVTSASPYYWEINSAATNAGTWDFTGLVVVGANVTLRNVTTFDSMAFSNCPSITATGCTLTNSSIKNVPTTNGSFVATSGTFTGCAIDVSKVTAGNYWWTGTNTNLFTNCNFVGGGGHAMQITAAGGSSITMSGCTFTGFGANGTTGAAINFTATTGTITLIITGTTNTPTYKSAGATIVISTPNVITFTNLVYNSEVSLHLDDVNKTLLANVENIGITTPSNATVTGPDTATGRYSFAYTHSLSNSAAFLVVNCISDKGAPAKRYKLLRQDVTIKNQTQDIPITQLIDRNYSNANEAESLYSIISNLGLTNGLKLCLDAGDEKSYNSAVQTAKWLDTSGNGYDFYRGSSTGGDASEPTFNGSAGGLSTNEYWSSNGDDYFSYDATPEAWMNNMHKDGALWTVIGIMYPSNSAYPTRSLTTSDHNDNAGQKQGIRLLHRTTGGYAAIAVADDTASYTLATSTTPVPNNSWSFVGFSVDEASGTNNAIIRVNSSSEVFSISYATPSTAASTAVRIGALNTTAAFQRLENNSRVGLIAVWEGTALTAQNLSDLYTALKARFPV